MELPLDVLARCGQPAMIRVGRARPYGFDYFARRARRFAGLLENLGSLPGDPIVVVLSARPERWEVVAGALRAGMPLLPARCGIGVAELSALVSAARAAIVVVDYDHIDTARAMRRRCSTVRHVINVDGLPQRDLIHYPAALSVQDPEHIPVAAPGPVLLEARSGGVEGGVDEARLQQMSTELAPCLNRRPNDLSWSLAPDDTVLGVVLGVIEPWSTGTTILIDDGETTHPGHVVEALERFPVTITVAVPPLVDALTGRYRNRLRRTFLRRLLAVDEDRIELAWAQDRNAPDRSRPIGSRVSAR